MPEILPSPEIWHRDDFPLLCNWRKLWRVAEVGFDRGVWGDLFMSRWIGHEYYGVDSYAPYPEMPFDREPDYHLALERMARHSDRFKLLKLRSIDAARLFPRGALDFIYIDGAHDYESVTTDLEAWYPALSEHGILAGHDWTDKPIHEGVKRAVTQFANDIRRDIYLTTVEGYNKEDCPSWYLYRGGMPGADWRRC